MTDEALKILLVEDSMADAELLEEFLLCSSEICFELVHVRILQDALDRLSREQFDIVLLDLSLPDRQGLETVKDTHAAAPQLPLVVLTGLKDEDMALQAVRAGAQDYLIKGEITPVLLVRSIRFCLERTQLLDRLRHSEERYALAVRGANDGIWDWNLEAQTVYFSPRWKSMLGYGEDELDDEIAQWFDRVHPDDLPGLKAAISDHLSGETEDLQCEYRIRDRHGHYLWMLVRGLVLQTENGTPYRMAGSQTDITERKRSEQEKIELIASLQESETRFRSMADTAPVFLWLSDPEGVYTFFNQPWLNFTGLSLAEALKDGWEAIVHPEDRERFWQLYHEAYAQSDRFRRKYRVRRSDGEYRWVLDTGVPRFHENGEFVGYIGSCIDITEIEQLQQDLDREKELAQVTLRSIGDAVLVTDALGKVQLLNPVAEMLTGWSNEEAQTQCVDRVFQIIDEATRQPLANPADLALRQGEIVTLSQQAILVDLQGREYPIGDSAAPIRDRDGAIVGAVLVFHDATEQRTRARQLSWQASHDPLTGLVNRTEFNSRLERAIERAKREGHQHALCYLDLDRFKIVNDTCGHLAGDELLRQVTGLLETRVRKTDTLARLGGDEFGLLLYDCCVKRALEIADDLRKTIEHFRFAWHDKIFSIGASIGVVTIDDRSDRASSVLKAADAACYTAKNEGRNRVHLYQFGETSNRDEGTETQWFSRIVNAIDGDRFRLYVQEIVPLMSTENVRQPYYEILLRMVDERDRSIPPMAFIPAAERYNLMPEVDRWVIRTLFACLADPQSPIARGSAGEMPLYSINVSSASVDDDDFIGFLQEMFRRYPIAPDSICFELTETTTLTHMAQTIALTRFLKQIGCHFAIDNFGSSISSLSYLKYLPIDYLKIDGNFIKNISDPLSFSIVEAIVRLGQVMGIQTIAQLVETPHILEKLEVIGVNYVQGYQIATPRPAIANVEGVGRRE
jgi:diguanylate cyclase (GGDEF)-like protein/PAS domain S-box-containing protein